MTTIPPYCVLDCEVERSPDSCRHCHAPKSSHTTDSEAFARCPDRLTWFEPLGWSNKADLGLSVGCYFHSVYNRMVFFDAHTLEATVRDFVEARPLIVGWNTLRFDLPLMRALLRRRAECLPPNALELLDLCDQFKLLCAQGYDLLAEIWKLAPTDKFTKGLNSLDAIAKANGLPGKTGTGAEAPRLWAQCRVAELINYNMMDVELTRRLFEQVLRQEPLRRSDGSSLLLPLPQEIA